jgi:hypothetical protein
MGVKPEIKVFIQALRTGKSGYQALEEYCWAKSVVPAWEDDYRRNERSVAGAFSSMAEACASDAFDDGADDGSIAAAFEKGLATDRERGLLWRAMLKHERPTAGQLVRAMSLDEQMKAGELFGYGNVARMFVAR